LRAKGKCAVETVEGKLCTHPRPAPGKQCAAGHHSHSLASIE
jgi:hypothetical protein